MIDRLYLGRREHDQVGVGVRNPTCESGCHIATPLSAPNCFGLITPLSRGAPPGRAAIQLAIIVVSGASIS